MEKTILSRNLRILRRKKQLTQSAFAARAGLDTARMVRIECGEGPTAEEMAALCRVLDVTEEILRCEKL